MIGVGGCAASDHTNEITRRNGVGCGAAQALAGVFALDAAFGQRQAAGAHGAVLTANTLDADGAGFHLLGTVEDRVYAQLLGSHYHLLGGRIDGRGNGIRQFWCFGFGFVCHYKVLLAVVEKKVLTPGCIPALSGHATMNAVQQIHHFF
jgi:hypothetical protein